MEPKLIMLDEPTSNMDIKARRELINFLNSLSTTKIISSHDLEFILETCKKLILLNNGSVEAFGPAKEILANKELMERCNQEVPHSIKS
jgi:cobalt/nickel transport system ATP-binding protein